MPKIEAQIQETKAQPDEIPNILPEKPVHDYSSEPPPSPEPNDDRSELEYVYRIAIELARRKAEALTLYEPLPSQKAFHGSTAKIRLAIGSNRSGKTTAGCVEVARAVTGCGGKWPKQNGRFYIVGKDENHVGQVLYRKYFRAGEAFKITRDDNGLWRAVRPGETPKLVKRSPPLIPPRFIESISWKNKKNNVPKVVKLKTGWEMVFFSSLGKPIQGVDIDGAHFDEEVVDPDWLPEVLARLLDRRGRLIWTATPQAATEALLDLHERAENRDPDVEEFQLLLADNPHMEEAEKKSFAASLNEDQYRVRILGEFAISGFRVYPEYASGVHACEPFEVPGDWTRYLVVDPGRQVCAVLFAAVPPDEKHVYLYDELYIKQCDAVTFGERLAKRIGDFQFEAFIIDHSGGRVTDTGGGRTIEGQYSEQLAKHGIESRRTKSGFVWGSDDVNAGIEATRTLLRVRPEGSPTLQVFAGRLPNFEWEVKHYHFKREAGRVTDIPVRKNDHLCACFRYLAMFNPKYRKPSKSRHKSAVLRVLEERRKLGKKSPGFISLGPRAR